VQVSAMLRDYQGEGALPQQYLVPLRHTGDRFCILMPGVPRVHAARFLEGLSQAIRSTSFKLTHPVPRVTLSVGLATFPDDSSDPPALLHLAEISMRSSHRKGRDRISTPADVHRG